MASQIFAKSVALASSGNHAPQGKALLKKGKYGPYGMPKVMVAAGEYLLTK
jgi:hypothetical protein